MIRSNKYKINVEVEKNRNIPKSAKQVLIDFNYSTGTAKICEYEYSFSRTKNKDDWHRAYKVYSSWIDYPYTKEKLEEKLKFLMKKVNFKKLINDDIKKLLDKVSEKQKMLNNIVSVEMNIKTPRKTRAKKKVKPILIEI